MRRTLWFSVLALGLALGAVGANGVVSAFTDEALVGPNSFESQALPRAVDLRLASIPPASATCGSFSNDLSTGLYSVANLTPNGASHISGGLYCLQNFGTTAAAVTVRTFDVVDSEVGCTGDEVQAGDVTCGSGAGELSSLVEIQIMKFGTGCSGGGSGTAFNLSTIGSLAVTPASFVTLAPGECINFGPVHRYNPSAADAQKAQSDRVDFRIAFNATA